MSSLAGNESGNEKPDHMGEPHETQAVKRHNKRHKPYRKGVREIPWGTLGDYPDQVCIYDNGHQDPGEFLGRVLEFEQSGRSDVPRGALEALTAKDVQHLRFRSMSPSEAKHYAVDLGVVTTKEGGYPVTAVVL